jgi:hypothetical protein
VGFEWFSKGRGVSLPQRLPSSLLRPCPQKASACLKIPSRQQSLVTQCPVTNLRIPELSSVHLSLMLGLAVNEIRGQRHGDSLQKLGLSLLFLGVLSA